MPRWSEPKEYQFVVIEPGTSKGFRTNPVINLNPLKTKL